MMEEKKSCRASSFEPGIEGEEKKKKVHVPEEEREKRVLFMIYLLSLFYYFPVFYSANLIMLYNGITPSSPYRILRL